jgi:hypothetical protein
MPLNSVEITKSLEPIKSLLGNLKQRIKDRDSISKFAEYSQNQREQEIAYGWIFAESEGNQYHF